jgi:predicted N-acyltransferase
MSSEPPVFTMRVLTQLVHDVREEEWNALVGDRSPFLEWGWLASLEEAGCVGGKTGWSPQHLALYEGDRLVAACPLYLKTNSEGEFVFDYAWADAAYRGGIDYYPKMLVGVPFTPAAGIRFLVAPHLDRAGIIRALGKALRELCEENQLSSVHVNFCEEDEAGCLAEVGFVQRLGYQYKWRNNGYQTFDDYLGALRHKRRNSIKRERRSMAEQGIVVDVLEGDAIPDEMYARMYRIYRTTVDKFAWGRRYLTPAFFELLRERFRHNLCFLVARREEEVVAGTFNVQKSGVLYGRYWGTFEELRHLHFNVCYYSTIEHCIASGLQRFEPGAGGEFKWLRGFDAEVTRSMHHLRDPRLADAVARYLEAEREEVERVVGVMGEHSQIKPKAADEE